MKKITIFITGCLLLCISLPAQDKPRELKGGGHLLGETVEQFYAESHVAELFAACQGRDRSEEHTSELQSHSFISYAVFCLKKKKTTIPHSSATGAPQHTPQTSPAISH